MTAANSSETAFIESFRLAPVIEIEPFPYKAEDRKHPEGPGNDQAGSWAAYWRDSLADSGIKGIEPIREASWYVATTSFSDSNQGALNRLLTIYWRHHKETPESLLARECSPLSGGLAMINDSNTPLLQPSCCGDLGNFMEWTTIMSDPPPKWTMLWIGHPWVHVKARGEWIDFSEESESNEPDRASFSAATDKVQRALLDAKTELTRFAILVEKALIQFGCSRDTDAIAQFLCGLINRTPHP